MALNVMFPILDIITLILIFEVVFRNSRSTWFFVYISSNFFFFRSNQNFKY